MCLYSKSSLMGCASSSQVVALEARIEQLEHRLREVDAAEQESLALSLARVSGTVEGRTAELSRLLGRLADAQKASELCESSLGAWKAASPIVECTFGAWTTVEYPCLLVKYSALRWSFKRAREDYTLTRDSSQREWSEMRQENPGVTASFVLEPGDQYLLPELGNQVLCTRMEPVHRRLIQESREAWLIKLPVASVSAASTALPAAVPATRAARESAQTRLLEAQV